ncbi:Glycosyl hydrolases family 2, sugar binding domain [Verrucomicrobium sp. GAS474]|uniref:glycoside hydrolase family 2 protein n=1 Tax=Verrucomicrobium sp. GAS474 TaxID=1882831 RepID=UPI00087DB17F|nr:glycoside hydrolase family 2 TIM barrel-domain containing protein [Verrucomicrobium sp. GAS474]SDT89154.1 Glycosyl hydrolases family 2, sugar binding domain [Verrucomicrobium sp. GAS474]
MKAQPFFPDLLFPKPSALPPLPGNWHRCGRIEVLERSEGVEMSEGFCVADHDHGDGEIVFRVCAPKEVAEVQIWAGFRAKDRHHRYVVALRGGNNDQLYLARYGSNGGSRFLGIAPLGFHPEPGIWYRLRVVLERNRIRVFLGDEAEARIDVIDDDGGWTEGAVVLGGGYLPAVYAPPEIGKVLVAGAGGRIAAKESEPLGRERQRRRQRAAYRGARIASVGEGRTEISLDGEWLFAPGQELDDEAQPVGIDADDSGWHLLPVPNLWTPCLAWLHGEHAFPHLSGLSQTKGVSERAYLAEMARLDGYTFPWRETQAGWYRHHVDLPAGLAVRKVELCFDAIAKVSEIWVNGIRVGGHVGMFGEVLCDISRAIRPGKNVIAVQVLRSLKTGETTSGRVVGLAESVEVTEKMLLSLPADMYQFDPGGIWQSVRLLVTDPVSIDDIFVQPRLDGALFDVTVANGGDSAETVQVAYAIHRRKDGALLFADENAGRADVPSTGEAQIRITTPILAPRLWFPHDPELYEVTVELMRAGKSIDRYRVEFGFRTFTTEKNRFLLNGKPYWLRGANHFPHALGPNDEKLADTFTRLAVEGNVRATRFHVAPLTKAWACAADRHGLAVSFEGIWPWLMLNGEPPADALLQAWEDDFASLVKRFRNHPSVVLWTVNNEMKFYIFDKENKERLQRKWAIVSRMIKRMRELDPTRPVVADSGYVRGAHIEDYRNIVEPNGFDDGDVDDIHEYYSWYHPSFTTAWKGEFAARSSSPDRPFICQELSSGYPRNDDGLPVRFYLFNHQTPQALVGDYAFEHNDPAHFLARHALTTRQTGEAIRRTNRDNAAGALHFAYLTWFRNVHDAATVTPWAPYHALRAALQPILLSLEHLGSRCYAGARLRRRVCVVNDSETMEGLPASRLEWSFVDRSGKILSRDGILVPAVPYYSNHWVDVEIVAPAVLGTPRVDGRILLRLSVEGRTLAENAYDFTVASREWTHPAGAFPARVSLYDPQGVLAPLLPADSFTAASLLSEAMSAEVIVADAADLGVSELGDLRRFVEEGGLLFLSHAGEKMAEFMPEVVKGYRKVDGEIVNFKQPESVLFEEIEPLDLAWFEGGAAEALACIGVYEMDGNAPEASPLAEFCDFHNYLQRPEEVLLHNGVPLLEARLGRGFLIASEMNLEAGRDEPVAARLLNNGIVRLARIAAAMAKKQPAFAAR